MPQVDQLTSFRLFDPSRLPSNPTKLVSYGEEHLEALCDFYGQGDTQGVDVVALKAEWEGFRFLMLQSYSQMNMLKVFVADKTSLIFIPNYRLAAIALILPVSSAREPSLP